MITILLFVQILSNGFAQIPNTSDEETLEMDLEMPSQASARNNHTSCGSNATLTNLSATTDSSTWGTWSNGAYGYYLVDCSIVGKNYLLESTISTSGWYSYSSWNWNETNNSQYMSETWTNLTAGTYCVNATLWEIVGNTTNYVDSDYPCFTLANSSGGGNGTGNGTGGNNSSCGSDSNLTSISAWTDATTYTYGTTVYADYYANCTIPGKIYGLGSHVTTSMGPGSQSTWNWNETNNNESMSESWTNLSVGNNWCVEVTLWDNSSISSVIVDSISWGSLCFAVTNASGSGGNNTGGNNNNCGNSSNLTDMTIWTSATTYLVGDAINIGWDVNCTVIGNNYTIATYISYGTTGVYGGSNWFGWTAQWNPMQFSDYNLNFAVGNYCLNATLYEFSTFVDYENTCFTVTNGSSGGGGNNTGGNNTNSNCGNSSNLTDMTIWTSATTYTLGDTVNFGWDVNCTVIGKNYTITTYISDGSSEVYGGSNWFGWTAQWNPMQFYDSISNFSVGGYCLNATLYEDSVFVDVESSCFTVTNGSSGGGNNTGNQNDAHCLIINNLTVNSTYYITLDLENICSEDINYPGINATADHTGVSGFNQSNWWYVIWDNATYNTSWQLSFDSSVQNGTNITLNFEAAILNCGISGALHDCPNSTLSYQFTFGSNNAGGNNTGSNNTAPYVSSIEISPSLPTETNVLTCGYTYYDLDNDPDMSLITWTINGVVAPTAGILSSGYTAGDFVTCVVSAHDGMDSGNIATTTVLIMPNSSGGNNTGGNNTGGNNTGGNNTGGNNTGGNNTGGNNTSINTAPQISSVMISPSLPTESDVLTCYYTYSDIDNDPDMSMVTWTVNGVMATSVTPTLSSGYTAGDFVTCVVSAHDGMDYGNVGTSTALIMPNSSVSGGSSGGGLPSIGVVGTIAAIAIGFIFTTRREDEE